MKTVDHKYLVLVDLAYSDASTKGKKNADVETAEDLIVLQTEDLNTNDQSFHCTYEDVAEYDNNPVWAASVGSTGKHKYDLHHCCVAYGKCADTQERKCIGKVAEQHFK